MFSIVGGSELKRSLDAWFASDPATRKKKILGQTVEENSQESDQEVAVGDM
jgi:hypothetical protein